MHSPSLTALLTQSLSSANFTGVLDLWLKSFLILLAAAALCLCARRRSAATRHLLWFLALAGLLFLPLLSRCVPASRRPLWSLAARPGVDNQITLSLQFPAALPAPGPRTAPATSAPAPARSLAGSPGQTLAAHFPTPWCPAALGVWLAGLLLTLASVALGWLPLRSLRRAAQPVTDASWLALLHTLRAELRLRRPVLLLQSAGDPMPVTWGSLRPVILLPAAASLWSPERRRLVLLHELAHVKRADCLTQLLARLACAAYWFNPLAWLAARQMCVERERACDDLVLNAGCRPSDYAAHLLDIARSFRFPHLAGIPIAHPSRLETRIAAIIDSSLPRRAPRALLVALASLSGLGLLAAVAAQKTSLPPAAAAPLDRPWFDDRLRAFFAAKATQARQLAGLQPVAPDVWPYFDAGINGDWPAATNLWVTLRSHAHQYPGTTPDQRLDLVWSPILETDLAWEQFANWSQKYVLAYGRDIINSIPQASIYFGGTDPGRGVITAMSDSHADAKPFFTLTQNALADGTYLDYLRAMYGPAIYTPSSEDSQKCFQEYLADARQRLKAGALKPNEDVTEKNGHVEVQGQVAVMSINGLLTRLIFDRNPNREFFIEESFPLDWMYPYLTPNRLILKINRQPLGTLSPELVEQDQRYWAQYLAPILGPWLNQNTSVAELAAFANRVYLRHDLTGFDSDPLFIQDTWAQKAFSKLRSSIAGLYAWRADHAQSPAEKQRLTHAADLAFRQAYALCPTSPEAVFRYVNLLLTSDRRADARLLAQTTLNLDPKNTQVRDLLEHLEPQKPK